MRINNLIARFLVNKATKEEWDTLESWKQESQENLSELLEMQKIWDSSIDLKGYKNFDKQSAWDLINNQIEESPAEPKKKILSMRWVGGIAATLTLLVAALFLMKPDVPEGFSHIASNDVIENFTLPDGSAISINKNSGLDYANNFEENRKIILEGEAYFDVARDEEHPFVITTDEATVKVLGTSFNIEEENGAVDVFVTSGKVQVDTEDETVILGRGDMVRCKDGKITSLSHPGRNYLSWQSRTLVFEETPLHKVVQDLSRHFNKKVAFSGESKAMNQQVTDTFKDEDFETVMETLVLITGIKYLKEGNTYVIQ